MEKEINILFLGGAKRVSLAEKFIEAGKTINAKVIIFSYELNDEVPIAFIGKIIIGLKWGDIKLYDHLKETIENNNIHIVIPFLDNATLIAAKLKTLLPRIFIPVSDVITCEIFFNKKKANEWCASKNIPIPSSSKFPMIAKPITGSASKGLIILESRLELDKLEKKENYLVQELIKGKEFSIDVYISPVTKKIISIVSRERLETQGGESIKSITIKNSNIIKFCENIITQSDLIGPITLQILQDSNKNNLYFMEINPRFGGAVLNSIEAGANSPLYLLNDFLGVKNKRDDKWQDGLLMIRRFTEYYKLCK